MKDHIVDEGSYMQIGLRLDGKKDLFLKVPTVWNKADNEWIGFVKTPISNKLIYGHGKDSRTLETSFNDSLQKTMQDPKYFKEVWSMFKPLSEL